MDVEVKGVTFSTPFRWGKFRLATTETKSFSPEWPCTYSKRNCWHAAVMMIVWGLGTCKTKEMKNVL
jgi:hypothetical protein